ncbi:hypothetical protein [Streptomyces sp. NBC_00273]|uniref:hypothetical protein n=1 Tax=Streptomyces sp. NBC_00273 TaxID=2903644 RepID=UPI002E2BF436|nr:hypothetical protein [Streptomyces sp. NBC_00273]
MTARLNLFSNPTTTTAKAAGYFAMASKTILEDSALPAAIQKLVALRAPDQRLRLCHRRVE